MESSKSASGQKRKKGGEEEDAHRFSIDKHAICCQQIIIYRNKNPPLLQNHSNFIQSGPPHRVLLHENGEWVDFLEEGDIGLVDEGFSKNKTVLFEVVFRGTTYLADFLHMLLIDIKTGSQRPIGWMNKAGKCFFPVNFTFHDCFKPKKAAPAPANEEEGGSNGKSTVPKMEDLGKSKPMRTLPPHKLEAFKRILTSKEKQHFSLNMENIDGMNDFSDERAKARLKLFENRVTIIESCRGKANVRYAWLGTTKEAVCRILRDGIVLNDLPKAKSTYGVGVHLASASFSHISLSYCDTDKNGLQHMVLCRVILGNREVIHPGSKQFCPSSKNFDSGVDDLLNPKQYIIWNKNMNTHIFPEYVVRFKRPPVAKGGKNYTACPKKPPLPNCRPTPAPPAGMFHVSMLLSEIEDKVPYNVMTIVHQFYEQQQKKKMSKDQLFQMVRLVVGDKVFTDTLTSLKNRSKEVLTIPSSGGT